MLKQFAPLKRNKPLARTTAIAKLKRRVRAAARKTASVKAHMDRVAKLGCLVCGQPATLHHVTASIHGGRFSRSDRLVTPLCPQHHQKVFDPKASDPISVEGLSHRGFYEKHGINLLAEAGRLWTESEAANG